MKFVLRHAGFFYSVLIYAGVWVLLPDVDDMRRAIGSILICFGVTVAVFGLEFDRDNRT